LGTLFSWNIDSPTPTPVVVKGHRSPIHSLLLAHNNQLVSVSNDGNIRTWNLSGNGIDSVANLRSGIDIFCAKLSPDGQKIVCGSKEKVVVFGLNDLKKAPAVFAFYGMGARVTALAFSPNGRKILTGNSAGVLTVWDYENDKIVEFSAGTVLGKHNSTVSDIVFSPDGHLVATSSFDWSVHLFNYEDITRQQQPIVINDFNTWVTGVRFTKDSKKLISYGADRTVRLWDIGIEELYAKVSKKITRDLTVDEWNKYVGKDVEFTKVQTALK